MIACTPQLEALKREMEVRSIQRTAEKRIALWKQLNHARLYESKKSLFARWSGPLPGR